MEPDVQRFVQHFRNGEFFEAHEVLEDRWRVSRSASLQGLIQIAAGCHHLSHGNLHGARSLWTKAGRYLARAGEAPEPGLDPDALRAWLGEMLRRLPPGRRAAGPLPEALRPPTRLPGLDKGNDER